MDWSAVIKWQVTAFATGRQPKGNEADLNALLPAFGVETDDTKARLELKAVASTERCKRTGFLPAVKHTDAPN